MSELINQLGLDWKLLLSQAVNFLLLLVVLRVFAYKPILKILKDRREKIEAGLTKAKEAEVRLGEIQELERAKMKEADEKAMLVIKATEAKAKRLEGELLAAAKTKETEMLAQTDQIIAGKAETARRAMKQEAAALVKAALIRTVELAPTAVDEALIKKAVEEIAGK